MLLSITTTHQPATDLGFLLRKHPDRHQTFDTGTGIAHVLYPEAGADRCTAAMIMEIDPIGLVRGRRGPNSDAAGLLTQYVNDRPYAASSFLTVAMSRALGSAMGGRSEAKPELADRAIPLTARVVPLRCRGGAELAGRLFAPLGYAVEAKLVSGADAAAPYVDMTIAGTVRLSDLLTHLYVLIPVLDSDKHYWVAEDEVDKLLRRGEGWLAQHPDRELITRRYLKHGRRLARMALERLAELDDSPESDGEPADEAAPEPEPTVRLNERRYMRVAEALAESGARSVLDLGCGSGKLLHRPFKNRQFEKIVGVDAATRELELARDRLDLDRLPESQRARVTLLHGALTYRDRRLSGFDAAAVVEVIEHLDLSRLDAFARVLFEAARPKTIVLTTPNAEYNAKYEGLQGGHAMRHADHRFEWTRSEFETWARRVADSFGYAALRRNRRRGPGTRYADADGDFHMELKIPDFSLVVLIGSSGSGKSTFAARHFRPTEILSSDRRRGIVSDDETDQDATRDAFDVLRYIAAKRLAGRRLTVVDATNVRAEDRKAYVELARKFHAIPVAIVLDMPEALCVARNAERPDRAFGARVVQNHIRSLRRSLRGLAREGFRTIHVLRSVEEIEAATIARNPLYADRRGEQGPFDIVGDVHGCYEELSQLLDRLGYAWTEVDGRSTRVHAEGRRLIFVGDLVDRGPNSPEVLRLAMDMVATGSALCVPGNHEARLLRKLNGRDVKITHGLAETLAQLQALDDAHRDAFVEEAKVFIDGIVSHLWLDDGKLVVAHAGMKEEMQGRGSGAVRSFALYGETTGETDEFGLPVRFDWAAQYRGKATVVYGHVPTPEAEWVNRTICIDTGCVFGGKLTALRYPELELVDVPALAVHCEPVRPLARSTAAPTGQQAADTMLDIEDVTGKRTITTGLMGHVRLESENAAAALEIMSRFCVDPRWLIYLPPTMSPPETSAREGLLEHPDEVFAHFARVGVASLIAEEKHMGSRAVLVLARDADAARKRFGTEDGRAGIVYTRTGRPFFAETGLEVALLERLSSALMTAGVWDMLATDWICLDAELMPWSVKAQALITEQYRPVGIAGRAGTTAAAQVVREAIGRGIDGVELLARLEARAANAEAYVRAYESYLWPVSGIDDIKLAPFHILASEGAVHVDKPHTWHMERLAEVCAVDPVLLKATPYRTIDLADDASRAAAAAWWEELTASGGEGMVVKPMAFVAKGKRGLVQPALKCRGREYLRIIYGPDYTLPGHLMRLRERGLGSKRNLALREFALGIEGLARFVAKEPLRRVHECAFGVLALESEPVDPRL